MAYMNILRLFIRFQFQVMQVYTYTAVIDKLNEIVEKLSDFIENQTE